MMKIKKEDSVTTDKHDRRRGRPAGKNRTPLCLEERRARNARYERERRNETADAMGQLAEAASCHPQIGNAELLATVISQLQRRSKRKLPQNIEDLKRINHNLESQIAALQSRLGQDIDFDEIAEDSNDCDPVHFSETSEYNSLKIEKRIQKKSESQIRETKTKRKSNFKTRKSEKRRPKKILKSSKSSSVHQERNFESDESPSDASSGLSSSDWSESVQTKPTQYKLRKRSQKVSEQSEISTTSTYRTELASSHYGKSPLNFQLHSEDSNQSDVLEHPAHMPNAPALSAIPEQYKEYVEHYDDQTESALLETLTEGEKRIINKWLDCSETVDVRTDHEDSKVRKFLDFDDFLLDINA